MITFLAMPGSMEWIFLLIFGGFLLLIPFFAIRYYTKYKELKKQNELLQAEKKQLLDKILEQK